MELNWSTFVLEIINFLVLVWILKHFLYRPVLEIVARRRQAIETQQQEAQALQSQADDMRQQYEARLSQWQQEQHQARADLERALGVERQQQHDRVQQELDQQRLGAEVAGQRQLQNKWLQLQHKAIQQGADFAAHLLQMAAGPEMETRLSELLMEQLDGLSPEQCIRLQHHNGERSDSARISSAYPIDATQRERLAAALQRCLPEITSLEWRQQPELLAGVRIAVGAWELGCNLADELRGFAELAANDRAEQP